MTIRVPLRAGTYAETMSEGPTDSTTDSTDSTDDVVSDERVDARSRLLPEEQATGSDDPHLQAATVLADSDERIADPEGTKRQ